MSAAIAIFFLYKVASEPQHLLAEDLARSLVAGGAGLFSLLILYSFTRSKQFRENIAISMVTLGAALFLADLVLAFTSDSPEDRTPRQVREAARSLNIPYDERTKIEVILDLRAAGQQYYPHISTQEFFVSALEVEGKGYHPVGGVAYAGAVLCNEGGYRATNQLDRYGFNNPDEVWDNEELDIVFIGDSWTEGLCLNGGYATADRVRERFPRTLNLGRGGNGPLSTLAALREMLLEKRARYVMWMYQQGDLADLNDEKRNPILRSYLSGDFTQGIIENHEAVNQALIQYTEDAIAKEQEGDQSSPVVDFARAAGRVLTLAHLKERAEEAVITVGDIQRDYSRSDPDYELFEQIIQRAKALARERGAELVFIWLPDLVLDPEQWDSDRNKIELFKIMRGHGIDVIDLDQVFKEVEDLKTVVPLGVLDRHFNEKGYEITANAIIEYLESR